MDNRHLIRTIQATLDSWQSLTDKQKGPDFQKSVDRLKTWMEELKQQE